MTAFQQTVAALRDYPDCVLTAVDTSGCPVSMRCRPSPSPHEAALRVSVPSWFDGIPGRASVLCHTHDDELWNLKSFFVLGELYRDGDQLVFRPLLFRRSFGSGLVDSVRLIRQTRRAARRYLNQRGLQRPEVPWESIEAAKKLARERRLG